jgi:hypothetical protein
MRARTKHPLQFESLLSRDQPIWFPGLANRLAQDYWDAVGNHVLDYASYGSQRWLDQMPSSSRDTVAVLSLDQRHECRVERLPVEMRLRYQALGLAFAEDISLGGSIELIGEALGLLRCERGIFGAVAALIRAIHLLEAPCSGYDVSHSDPELPFSVFLSLPLDEPEASVRTAESILHECMHLQLTLIEWVEPLVADPELVRFSPWRQQDRPIGGLLHGLYVFCVIDGFLAALSRTDPVSLETRRFITKRRAEIAREIEQVRALATGEGLTTRGGALARRLLDAYSSGAAR